MGFGPLCKLKNNVIDGTDHFDLSDQRVPFLGSQHQVSRNKEWRCKSVSDSGRFI